MSASTQAIPAWSLPTGSLKDRLLLVPPRRRALTAVVASLVVFALCIVVFFPDSPGRALAALPFQKPVALAGTALGDGSFNGIMDGVGAHRTVGFDAQVASSRKRTKGIVLASRSARRADALSWLKNVDHEEWQIYHYESDMPRPGLNLAVPKDAGREAMVFLTYIIDHYPDFPDIVLFHHGHRRAWHQPPPTDWLLRAIDLDVVARHGWISLRCINTPSCAPQETWVDTVDATTPPGVEWNSEVTRGLLRWTFRPGDPWHDPSIGDGRGFPPWLGSTCCAQFAVTRERLLARSRAFWQRVRQPMLDGPGAHANWSARVTEWSMGVAYERSWHYFFGMPGVSCLDEDYCRAALYRGRIWCDERTARWNQSQEYERISCTYNDDEAQVHLEMKGEAKTPG